MDCGEPSPNGSIYIIASASLGSENILEEEMERLYELECQGVFCETASLRMAAETRQ